MLSSLEYTMDSSIFRPLHTSLSNARKKWTVLWRRKEVFCCSKHVWDLKFLLYAYFKKISGSLNSTLGIPGRKAHLNDILSLSNSEKRVDARYLSNFTGDCQSCQDRAYYRPDTLWISPSGAILLCINS